MRSTVLRGKHLINFFKKNKRKSSVTTAKKLHDFVKDIDKLDLANERKKSIPMEILDENA